MIFIPRQEFLDIAKGLAILLVILGHAPTLPVLLQNLIYMFHIPAFFFISGYLFNFFKYKSDSKSLIVSKFQRLILPYFVTFILLFLYWSCVRTIISLKKIPYTSDVLTQSFSQTIISCFYANGAAFNETMKKFTLLIDAPLWFLVCLFCAICILYFIVFIHEKKGILYSGVFCLIIILCGFMISRRIFLPWGFDIACVSMAFMFSGYLFRKNNYFSDIKEEKLWVVLLILLFFIILFVNGRVDMNNRIYNGYSHISATNFVFK